MQNDPLIGRQLGAYRIQALLGEGGMARVYKGYHERLQREVAIKVIRPQSAGQSDFQVRFEREAQLVANLQHRNIVVVYDFGESENLVFLVMQYVARGTLRDQLIDRQPLEPRRAALYALQMARALHHAHLRGFVHRDVKPLNMLVSATNRNELLLSDFGLAKLFARSSETLLTTSTLGSGGGDPALSHAGNIMGTPQYMAPEQCLGRSVDARTDVYALGVVLFEMLTGQLPFRADTSYALLYQHAHMPAPHVREINPAVPEALAQITAKALLKKPEERYQSAREMAQALETVLSPPAPVVRPAPSNRRRSRRNFWISPIAVMLLTILLAVVQFVFGVHLVNWPGFTSATSTLDASIQNTSAHTAACTPTQAATRAQAFVETFQDDQRGWQQGSPEGLTSIIAGNAYTLEVIDNRAHFLCPDSTSVGTLPENFSLAAQITQKQGSSGTFYGLAFQLRHEKDITKVYGYSFVINGQGQWAVLKYDPNVSKRFSILKSGQDMPAIHDAPASNTLQVTVQGSRFSFKINGNVLLINGSGQADQTIIDQSYLGGQLGLLVDGPNSTFIVTSVILAIP